MYNEMPSKTEASFSFQRQKMSQKHKNFYRRKALTYPGNRGYMALPSVGGFLTTKEETKSDGGATEWEL